MIGDLLKSPFVDRTSGSRKLNFIQLTIHGINCVLDDSVDHLKY